MTLPILAALLTGPLERYATTLLPPEAACDALPGPQLLDPVVLADVVMRFGRRYGPSADIRASASVWSKHHFAAWMIPGLAANLLLDHDLPLALDGIGIVLAPEGQTTAIRLPGPGATLSGGDRFATIRDHHLTPLIEALARISGASPRVFWSNAGNLFENVVRQLEQLQPQAPGPAAADAFLRSRSPGNGQANPLFAPVRYGTRDGAQQRKRRVCCLRYLGTGLDYCSTCPLPAAGIAG